MEVEIYYPITRTFLGFISGSKTRKPWLLQAYSYIYVHCGNNPSLWPWRTCFGMNQLLGVNFTNILFSALGPVYSRGFFAYFNED